MFETCKNGFYHDKPVNDDREPSSNNGWIYSAYAQALGFPLERDLLEKSFKGCISDGVFMWTRIPGVGTPPKPPISRDELIGMASLGFPLHSKLSGNKWRWINPSGVYALFSTWEQLKAVWSLKDRHRNFVWESHILGAYPTVFRLGFSDRYYFKKLNRIRPNPLEWFFWTGHKYFTRWTANPGDLNILWLQCNDIEDEFRNKIDINSSILDYFGPNHPFNKYKRR